MAAASSSSSNEAVQCAHCSHKFEPTQMKKFEHCAHVGCGPCVEKGDCCRACLTCAICLNDMKDDERVSIANCDHQFCRACITRWSESASTCPSCNKQIGTIKAPDGSATTVKRRAFHGPDNLDFPLHLLAPDERWRLNEYEYDGWLVPDDEEVSDQGYSDDDDDDDDDDDGIDDTRLPAVLMTRAHERAFNALSHLFDRPASSAVAAVPPPTTASPPPETIVKKEDEDDVPVESLARRTRSHSRRHGSDIVSPVAAAVAMSAAMPSSYRNERRWYSCHTRCRIDSATGAVTILSRHVHSEPYEVSITTRSTSRRRANSGNHASAPKRRASDDDDDDDDNDNYVDD